MTFDLGQIFLVVHAEQLVSIAVTGFLLGYVFIGKVSAHLSPLEWGFRTFIIGGVFLVGLGLTRLLGGASAWEMWIGILLAFFVYNVGCVLGLVLYDRRLKRAIERQLGHPLRSSPRGIFHVEQRRKGDDK
jgi:hypothetical protein